MNGTMVPGMFHSDSIVSPGNAYVTLTDAHGGMGYFSHIIIKAVDDEVVVNHVNALEEADARQEPAVMDPVEEQSVNVPPAHDQVPMVEDAPQVPVEDPVQ